MDTINNDNQTGLVVKRQVQVEAISKAVYLVTGLFEENEPLKMSLRRVAVDCIENTNKKYSLIKLNSLIKLSKDIDLISSMNADILSKVIDEQLSILNLEEKTNIKNKDDIKIDDVFTLDNPESYTGDVKEKVNTINPVAINHADAVIVNKGNEKSSLMTDDISEKKIPNITIHNNTQNIKTINNISMDIGSRRKRILEIVKTRGAVTINEFIDSIKGCSSKTIQRELTSLVLSGTLKKTGERRWSRYSLK